MLVDRTVTAEQPPATRRKPRNNRSRVGNGNALLAGIDQRSPQYREYQDAVSDLCAHLGNDPTATERAVIEEAAGLVVWCRAERLKLLTGGEFQIGSYTTAVNSLRRLLVDLGLEQRMTDVTPTIDQIVAQHRKASAE